MSLKANRDQIDISVGQERSNNDQRRSSEVKDKRQEEDTQGLQNQNEVKQRSLEANRVQTEVPITNRSKKKVRRIQQRKFLTPLGPDYLKRGLYRQWTWK